MTVFIPEGSLVGQGAVGDSDIVIVVVGGEGSTLVVSHGVTWWRHLTVQPRRHERVSFSYSFIDSVFCERCSKTIWEICLFSCRELDERINNTLMLVCSV